MSSRPGFFFYTNDYYADTAACSASTRGVWMDVLSVMNKQGKGTLSLPPKQLQTATRCTKREIERALMELERDGVAEIFRPKNCDLIVIKSHRFTAYLEDLESKRIAEQERQKMRKGARIKDSVTEPVTQDEDSGAPALVRAGGLIETRAREESSNRGEEVKEREEGSPREKGFTARNPPSLDEIKTYFTEKNAPPVEAEKFFNHFTANGWRISGKAPMRSWRHAASNWILNIGQFNRNGPAVPARASPPSKPDPPPRSFTAEYMEVEAENFGLLRRHFRNHDTNKGERWTLTQEGEKVKRQRIEKRRAAKEAGASP